MRDDMCVVLGGVGLVKGNIREASPAMIEITREVNPYLVADGFLADAPFKLLNGIIRFGTKLDPEPEVGPINRRHNELPFAVEVDMAPLKLASKEQVKAEFLKAIVPALFSIALEYELPVRGLTAFSEANGFAISRSVDEPGPCDRAP